ncbi:hypothetical protein HDU87_004500 [Geranomyces variabilis]|uniref:KxDL domain-containing protein n=1 Tax=Geranomyces variabilis TaxID=109894 RepID=A0AAD5TKZ9_9FUNG|nr:hypothetical protein HDU87_004500 [Geranomyces variabilis]
MDTRRRDSPARRSSQLPPPAPPPPLDTAALTRSHSSTSSLDADSDSAAKSLTKALASVVDEHAMIAMLAKQQDTVDVLRSTTQTLERSNDNSALRYVQCAAVLTQHTAMLKEMKTDLEGVFKRIRALKAKVAVQHPAEYREIERAREAEEEALDV